MISPHISRLRTAISNAATIEDRLILRAELAGVLARYGDWEQANAEVKTLRSENSGYEPRVTAWILLAEGLVSHFSSLTPDALRSFRAAHAIGVAIGRNDISSIASAWAAASEFLGGSIGTAAKHAIESIALARPDSYAALSRAHLVLADCLSCSDQIERAKKHYALAREAATRIGDISMQSVVLFNATAFSVSRLSLADATVESQLGRVPQVELQVESVANLDSGIGLAALSALVPLLRAQIHVVATRWRDAIALYQSSLPIASRQGQQRWLAKFFGDLALCWSNTGATKETLTVVASATEQLPWCSDFDDKAIAHARIAKALRNVGEVEEARSHEALAKESLVRFRQQQLSLQRELSPLLDRLTVMPK